MGNKVIRHYNEYSAPLQAKDPPEVDKTKSISQLNRNELWQLLSRLRDETEAQELIKRLKNHLK